MLATTLTAVGATAQPAVAVTTTAAGLAMMACLWRGDRSTPTDWLIAQALLAMTSTAYALDSRRDLGTLAAGAVVAAAAVSSDSPSSTMCPFAPTNHGSPENAAARRKTGQNRASFAAGTVMLPPPAVWWCAAQAQR